MFPHAAHRVPALLAALQQTGLVCSLLWGLLVFSWPSLMRSLMVYRSIFPSERQYVFHSLYKTIAGPPAAAAAQINSQHVKVAAVKQNHIHKGFFFPLLLVAVLQESCSHGERRLSSGWHVNNRPRHMPGK